MDLNLIRVFATVYEEGSVTAAAERLHLSQPSVTQALNRLRQEAGDALFMRSGRGITPTRSADQLYLEIGHLAPAADAAVKRLTNFDPATSVQVFRLALTDLGQALFLPAIHAELAATAPLCTLEVVSLDINTVSEDLESGRIDLAIASTVLAGNLRTTTLRNDVYGCIARKGRFGRRKPSFSEMSSLPRIVATHALGHKLLESQMPSPPPGSVYLPAFTAMPHMVADSDLVAFVPKGFVGVWGKALQLEYWPLPPDHFTSIVRAHTARQPPSVASAWFTERVIDVVRALNNDAS